MFHRGPVFANLILADEINRTPPKTQAALLEAMQELAVTVNGKTYHLEPPFIVVATQNPIEQEGTYPLPEAQLDRFMLSIHVDYPGRADELTIAARPLRGRQPTSNRWPGKKISGTSSKRSIKRPSHNMCSSRRWPSRPPAAKRPECGRFRPPLRGLGSGARAPPNIWSRPPKPARCFPAAPRPEVADINRVASPVLRHRIIPNYNALGEGIDADAIIKHLLEQVVEPVGVS